MKKYIQYLDENEYMKKYGNREEMKKFAYTELGMGVLQHNVPCFVCFDAKAVLSEGGFQPCWQCQAEGHILRKLTWFERLIRKWTGEQAFIEGSARKWGRA